MPKEVKGRDGKQKKQKGKRTNRKGSKRKTQQKTKLK